ncbi:DNA-directed RNA polymerase I subunit RPA1 [Trichogramma pretiosum]|uniref:DNA-directed RNA polymerase I subunit RPA1 n=1 Tax=Trichogramma pretiosum TaxID=7493 RepID=UPI0006C9ADEC|nr:DNA-directed RNA polymerase I subunit RPA1 [Trichogramma pretiosum]
MNKNPRQNGRITAKHIELTNLKFSVLTEEDIKHLSCKKVTTPDSFNSLGHPLHGGLHDPHLGPLSETSEPCKICNSNVFKCTGHYGHIELPMPVVNPMFHKALQLALKISCLSCYTFQMEPYQKVLLASKLKLLRKGYITKVEQFESDAAIFAGVPLDKDWKKDIELVENLFQEYIQSIDDNAKSNNSNIITEEPDCLSNKNMYSLWYDCINKSMSKEKSKATDKGTKDDKKCKNCKEKLWEIKVTRNKIRKKYINSDQCLPVMPDESKKVLRNLWVNEKEIMRLMFPCLNNITIEYPTDIFFFSIVPVLPLNARPVNYMNGSLIEHPQTQIYRSIIVNCLTLRNIIQAIKDGNTDQLPEYGKKALKETRGETDMEKLHNVWTELQSNVDHTVDRDMSSTTESANCQGLKQVIEKKAGVLRMHMMGKRVNFAARSVITPDPNLNVDEIGIPEAFATKLTYPVPVTPFNAAELRQMILNGPNVHPGATMIEEDGFVKRLSSTDAAQRQALAKRLLTADDKPNNTFSTPKIVHRHLQNGDILLLNRQPTLHKPSIMGHKARILRGEKTLRLHYANCKAYNADFDGDEMNAHFPQNELARAEAYNIANVSNQYLVPKDGKPLSGLIQDHVISGVKLTLRGNFFTKGDYMQLVFSALSDVPGKLSLLPPSIIKPVQMWSGKQVISTIIINLIPRGQAKINLDATSKIGANEWQAAKPREWKCGTKFDNANTMSEAEVIFRDGELLCGVLDKKHYGATEYGLVHCAYELYGGTTSGKLLSAFGKVFMAYLRIIGFTLGPRDIIVTSRADAKRAKIIEKCRRIGKSIHRSILQLPEDTPDEQVAAKMEESYSTNPKFRNTVDRKYKTSLDEFTNKINKTCLPQGLIQKFPENNLQLMVQSGAKGSTVNTMQISCLLGQIELEGKRPPLMISGKSLPSFLAYDPAPRAGGFIDGRFMTGIQPQEFFFHCMAGREGLIDTAVKTSRSGYLQRCLIKHMEGLTIHYDGTVRDSDGTLVQVAYGEDGLDILKSRFLDDGQMDFLVKNRRAVVEDELLERLKSTSDVDKFSKQARKIRKFQKNHGDLLQRNRISPFLLFSKTQEPKEKYKLKSLKKSEIPGRSRGASLLLDKWLNSDDATKNTYKAQVYKSPQPLIGKYRQDLHFGVLNESQEKLIDNYMQKKSKSIDRDDVRDILCAKIMKTFAPPGEPVGLLAAQSIGEPSTQMTLNTFHFAGRGEMNVTLGIPRLREILMTASKNIKTPTMDIPFKKDLPNLEKIANRIKKRLNRCYLADILKNIKIERQLENVNGHRMKYEITLELLPYKCYKNEFVIHPKDAIAKFEVSFIKGFLAILSPMAKKIGANIRFKDKKVSSKAENAMLDDECEDDDDDKMKTKPREMDLGELHESSDEEEMAEDADATLARSVAKHQENQEYDDPEDEDMEEEKADADDDKEKDEDVKQSLNSLNNNNNNNNDECTGSLEGSARSIQNRKDEVKKICPEIIGYDFDVKHHSWVKYELSVEVNVTSLDIPKILRGVAKDLVIWEVPNIKKAYVDPDSNGGLILKTDGINIEQMFRYHDYLELNKLYTNDIYQVSQTYGIEAANKVILKEVKNVFNMYSITVDPRHLSLVADYMTFDGSFQPMSRKGMETSASPLQQMSFESSLQFLRQATVEGKQDNLMTPSSRLMVGQPSKIGTGFFSLRSICSK